MRTMPISHLQPLASPPAPCAASASAPGETLDLDALARLRELDPRGEQRLLQRVLRAFETSMGRLLPQLQQAHLRSDHHGVRHVAHTLKSSSASIGAVKLSQLCVEIETMIRLDTLQNLDAHISALCDEAARVLRALEQLPEAQQ